MLYLADTGTSLQHLQAAAAPSTGTPTWLTALIAALAAVLAAFATAFSSAYAAKRKVAEIELANAFQLASKYLESARQYTQNVYLPLAIAVHNLHAAFLDFKAVTEESEASAAKQKFSDEISTFLTFTNDQFKAGASAVFTFKLDDALTGFISFLGKSRSATESATANEVQIMLSFGYFGWRIQRSLTRQLTSSLSSYDELALRILGMGIGLRQNPVLVSAPLSSDDFAKRFTLDLNGIKTAIKEVTLGTYSAPSGK